MQEITLDHYIVLSMFMFTCGVVGVLVRKNIIFVLLSLELILNSTNILFVSASAHLGNLDGQIMTLFVITVAACEAGVALAMIIAIYRRYGTIKTDFLKLLRG
jgi:NADH-quinone oxidoreductase subunit K